MVVFIGSGAGFAGDRFDAGPAVVKTLARHSGPRYLIFEVMGERTLAIAQRKRREDPALGYSPYLDHYLSGVLADCRQAGIRIVANLGNANPLGGARRVQALAGELGITGLRVAVVLGDDLLAFMTPDALRALPTLEGLAIGEREILAANAYLGARPVAAALDSGADVVLVGRTTDAALVLGPLIHEFGWCLEDWDRLAAGTLVGHLLECGGQVTGGYFCDPGFKDVPDLANLGFPIAEVGADGSLVIGKAAETGGLVTRATVIEQLLYEVHDPAAYLTPDVTMDLTEVSLAEAGVDRIALSGARGKPPPDRLKATISSDGGWLGEAEMSYAGPNALARARLAADIVRERCERQAWDDPVRVEVVGDGALFDNDRGDRQAGSNRALDGEFRLRAAIRSPERARAEAVADEVLSLFCSGPAAGGGFRKSVAAQVSTSSVLVARAPVEAQIRIEEVMP